MKDVGILFADEMVCAIINNRKWKTRRIVNMKTLRVFLHARVDADMMPGEREPSLSVPPGLHHARINAGGAVTVITKRGEIGVKPGEFTFRCPYADGSTDLVRLASDPNRQRWTIDPSHSTLWVREAWRETKNGELLFRATDSERNTEFGRWKPSIHLPRNRARLALRVTRVTIERLHDIDEYDARAEGVAPVKTYRKVYPSSQAADVEVLSYRDGFAKLWMEINGQPSWANNPWVWVVKFEKLDQCCRYDHNNDGNCHVHSAPGVLRIDSEIRR